MSDLTNLSMDKVQEFYQAKNLTPRDSGLLSQLMTDNISSISKTIAAIQDLEKNLAIYKECLVDSINLESESADLASKYATNEMEYNHFGTLPGVVSAPKSYNIDAVKADSDRMTQIQSQREKVSNQKETYLRICKEDVKVFIEAWKALNYNNAYWNEYIETLNKAINGNY